MLVSIAVAGCAKQEPYEAVYSSITEEQSYAYVKIGNKSEPALLVTDAVYRYEDNIDAGLSCEIYYEWEERAKNLGHIESQGTAYPIRYAEDGIYIGGPHFAARYVLDDESKRLVLAEFANETFDENADVTYTYSSESGEEQQVKDDSALRDLMERYNGATVVNFKKK